MEDFETRIHLPQYRKLHTFKGKWSEKKLLHILATIEKVSVHYNVTAIAYKTVHSSLSSVALAQLTKRITKQCRQKGIKLYCYSIEDIVAPNRVSHKKAGRKAIMNHLLLQFPELLREVSREKNNRHPYYLKLFEAIAVARLSS